MSDQTVKLRVSGDSSGAESFAKDSKAQIAGIGDAAQKATSTINASFGQAQSRMDQFAKSGGGVSKTFSDQQGELAKLLGKIDPVVSAYDRLDKQYEALKRFKASGAISGDDFAVYAQKIDQARNSLDKGGASTHSFTLNTAAARLELGRLFKDLATGQTGRFEQTFTTLAVQSGALGAVFSTTGVGALGLVAILGGLLLAYNRGASEQAGFERGLIATGNAAGTSAGQLFNQASQIGAATGQYGKAQEALTQLAASGKLSGDALGDAARGAVSLSEVTGQSIEKTVAEFEKLADDPVKSVVKLNDSYHFLTGAIYDQIKALQDEGRQEDATSLAIKTLADTMDDRRQQMIDSAGSIERAWIKVKGAIGEAIDNLKQVGRTDLQGQLQAAYAEQENIAEQRQINHGGGVLGFLGEVTGATAMHDQQAADVAARIASLQKLAAEQDKTDLDAAKQTHLRDNEVAAQVAIDATTLSLDKQAQKAKALQDLNQNFAKLFAGPSAGTDPRLQGVQQLADGGFSGGQYDTLRADINKKYADHSGDRDASIDASARAQVIREANKDLQASIDLNEKLANGYSGPWAKAQNDYDAQIEKLAKGFLAINTLLGLGQIGPEQYAEAWKRLSDDTAAAGDRLDKARESVGSSNAIIKAAVQTIDDEIEARGKSKAALAAETLARQVEQKIIKDGVPYEKSQIDALKAEATARNAIKAGYDYADKQKEQVEQLRAEIDARGQLDPMQQAEVEIQRLMPDLLKGDAEQRQKVIDAIRDQAKSLEELQAIHGLGNDLTGIFTSAAQSVANGGNAFVSLRNAAVPALDSISKKIGEIIKANTNATSGTVDWSNALDGLGDSVKQALPALGQLAGTVLGGGGNGAQTGSAIGSVIGGIVGSFIPVIGTALGAAIGGLLGGVVGGQGDGNGTPAIYGSSIPGSGGRDGTAPVTTPLGIFAADTDNMLDDAYKQFEAAVKGFDIQLAKLLSPDQLSAAQDALKGFSGKFGDINSLLQARFDVVLGSMDATIRDFVNNAATDLQGRVQALADVLALKKISDAGDNKLGSFEDALQLVTEFQKAGESIADTFNRLTQATIDWQQAMKLAGFEMEGDAVDIARFAGQIAEAANGTQLLTTFLKDFYDGTDTAVQNLQDLHDAATKGLTDLGLDPSTTKDQFRAAFEQALPTLTPDEIATWLKAGVAISDATKAEEAYADALKQGQVDYAQLIAGLGQEGAGISSVSPFAAARLQIEKWEQDTIKQANALAKAAGLQGASEKDLTLIHEVAAHRIAAAMIALEETTADLVDQFYDRGKYAQDAADGASSAVSSFGDAMTSTAQAAQSAAQLLLGELSPLNDQQKLQYALGAYQDGLINKEDVLEVGRRLYASSQKYEDLFNLLQRLPGGIRQTDGVQVVAAQSSAASDYQHQETDAEVAQRRHAEAEQISQNIASLSLAQDDKSYQDIADTLKVNLSDLSEALGLSQDDFVKYLDNLKAQENAVPDSIGDSTDRIVAALYDIAGRAPPADPTQDDARDGGLPGVGQGHSTHALPGSGTTTPPPIQRGAGDGDSSGHSMVVERLDRLIVVNDRGHARTAAATVDTATAVRDVDRSIQRGSGPSTDMRRSNPSNGWAPA